MSAAKITPKYKGLTIAGEAFVARFNRLEGEPHADTQTPLTGETGAGLQEVRVRRRRDRVRQLRDRDDRVGVGQQAAVPVADRRGDPSAVAVLRQVVALVEHRDRLSAEHVEDVRVQCRGRATTQLDWIPDVHV